MQEGMKTTITHEAYQVVVLPFNTGKVHEAIVLNEDGSYTIFIDDNLSPIGKQRAYDHAMMHILRNDFYSNKSIGEIEALAHSL